MYKIGSQNWSRKSFLVGVTGGVVIRIGTASRVVVIINNHVNRKLYKLTSNSIIGTVILITEDMSELSLESAKYLTVAGATIILTSWTASKGEMVVESIKEYVRIKGTIGTLKVASLFHGHINWYKNVDREDQIWKNHTNYIDI